MNIGIIGLGLIGASIGLKLRKSNYIDKIYGNDLNLKNSIFSEKKGIVDKIIPFQKIVEKSSVIILSVPVDKITKMLPNILNRMSIDSVVLDTGSTKNSICNSVYSHPKRNRFVATHPIAGVEYSGPIYANPKLFDRKNCIICDHELSDPDAIVIAKKIFSSIMKMHLIYIDSKVHDLYISYTSHLPHLLSFTLAKIILKKFNKKNFFIKNLMGSGFLSSIRLAKSNPNVWRSIFVSNRKNLIKSIDSYIYFLNFFKNILSKNNLKEIIYYMKEANEIIKFLKKGINQ